MEERTCLDPCLRVDLKLAQTAASRGEDSDLDGADVAGVGGGDGAAVAHGAGDELDGCDALGAAEVEGDVAVVAVTGGSPFGVGVAVDGMFDGEGVGELRADCTDGGAGGQVLALLGRARAGCRSGGAVDGEGA